MDAVMSFYKKGAPPSVVASILAHEFRGKGASETLFFARRPPRRKRSGVAHAFMSAFGAIAKAADPHPRSRRRGR